MKLVFSPDEVYRAPTDDGASIALGRYQPRGPRRFVEPVVLCHGLGSNRFNMDFDEEYSLARYLARRGFETWVLELRGRGLAGPRAPCTFDDQAEHDLRAAMRVVKATGAPEMTWVGHSKGGLALYAHLARNPEAPVRAAVALGSPLSFVDQPGLQKFVRALGPLLDRPVLPTAQVSHLALFGVPPGPVGRYLLNQSNIAPEVVKAAMTYLASDIAGGVARQLADWVRTDRFHGLDGLDYRAALAQRRVPFLLVAGANDLMAPESSVFHARERLGGEVETTLAGVEGGFESDYGHADLILGRRAPKEVFPRIEDFLARRSTPT